MTPTGFVLFDTALGRCGIAWGFDGIVGVQLPEERPSATRTRLRQRFPGAREQPPPKHVARAIADIEALIGGERRSLDHLALDMRGLPPFAQRVYETVRKIPAGKTLSYGEVARLLGAPGAARAVGQALGKNPFALVVPCHRVLGARGSLGGFSASGGVSTKRRLLACEGWADPTARQPTRGAAFGFDPSQAIAELCQRDTRLARLIEAVGPFRMQLKHTASVFQALAESVVYQQLTGKAAATIWSRVCALYPESKRGPTPELVAGTPALTLRGAGLSAAKALALHDLAARTLARELPTLTQLRAMPDETIIERLTTVRGIGRWTVEMLLIFRLGRPDVLPLDDYGVRKGYCAVFGKRELPSRRQLQTRGARWSPYRSVASWYLWRALELQPTRAPG